MRRSYMKDMGPSGLLSLVLLWLFEEGYLFQWNTVFRIIVTDYLQAEDDLLELCKADSNISVKLEAGARLVNSVCAEWGISLIIVVFCTRRVAQITSMMQGKSLARECVCVLGEWLGWLLMFGWRTGLHQGCWPKTVARLREQRGMPEAF